MYGEWLLNNYICTNEIRGDLQRKAITEAASNHRDGSQKVSHVPQTHALLNYRHRQKYKRRSLVMDTHAQYF